MHVLVAGCGWLGGTIARRLVLRGDRVTAIVRSEGSASKLRSTGIETVALDLSVPGAASGVSSGFDGVIAAYSAAGRDVTDYRRAYVDATRTLLESDAATRVPFVYVGSTGVFGQSDGSWVDETTPPLAVEETSEVLVEAERLVLDDSRHAARPSIVRCSGLYGPGRTGTIERVRTGALALGPGDDAWMNFCHRDDAATTVIAALDRGRRGAIYHASDQNPATRREVILWIAERFAIDPPKESRGDAGPRGRRGAHRRVSAEATRRELSITLAYPSFREGYLETAASAAS